MKRLVGAFKTKARGQVGSHGQSGSNGSNMKSLIAALLLSLLLCFPLLQGPAAASANGYVVSVSAGRFDRSDSVVSFQLPEGSRAAAYHLRGESGEQIPIQIDASRRASFILRDLRAGAIRTYRLEASKADSVSQVELTREGDTVKVSLAGRDVLRYQGGKGELPRPDIKTNYRRGGYLHPVFTPNGRIVTDDYPPNHLHHHGIWFPWTKTEFEDRHPDFWNMGDGTGTVEFESPGPAWSGAVEAGFESHHRFVDLSAPTPKVALKETWEVAVYNVGQSDKPYRMFDLTSFQECASSAPLILPEYHYGGLGFRGNREWDGKGNAFFLTSEGYDRADGHATRARWCHIGGLIGGQLAGIAILCHPDNFRAPQPVRIHPTEPFFCYAPSQMGRWGISPGHSYVSRYRFIVYDGPPDAAQIERLWNDYANPPSVVVTAS